MNFKIKLVLLISLMSCNLYANKASAKMDYYEAALQAYNRNDVEEAFIHLKNALQENESNLPAKLLLAEVLIKKNFYSSAEQELNDAILQGADINLIISPLGRSLLLQGKFDQILQLADHKKLHKQGELTFNLLKAKAYRGLSDSDAAEKLYQNILVEFPNNVEAILELASIYNGKKDTNKVVELIQKASLLAPENSKLWQLKGQLSLSKGQPDNALVNFIKANELDPEDITISRAMASTYIELGSPEKAQAIIDQILLLYPNDIQTQLIKSSIYRTLDKKQLSDEVLAKLTNQLSSIDEGFMLGKPELLLIDAISSYRQENWPQAQKKFLIYINQGLDKNDMSPVVLLADTYVKLNQSELALKLLANYESDLIKNKDYALILAGLYLEFNQTFKADYVLNLLQELYKDDEDVLILKAKVLSKTGRNEEALLLLESAKISGGVNYKHTLAVIALQLGKLDKSLLNVQSLITTSPENINYQLLYASILLQLQQYDNAEKVILDLHDKYPDNKQVRFSYALLQFNKNNYPIAQSMLEALVKADPEDGESWFILAQIAYDQGDMDKTIAILERQTKNDVYRVKALHKLAGIYYSQEKYEKSLEVINVLLQKSRLDTDAISMRVKNLIALKEIKEAKRQFDILFGLWSKDAKGLLQLSRLQLRVVDYDGAEKSLDLAYELEPRALPVIIDIVKVKIKLNKLAEATKLLTQAENLGYQNNAYIIILKGDIAVEKNNVKAAFNHYSSVLEKYDSNVIALIKLSEVGQTEELSNKFIHQISKLINKYPERTLQRHIFADHLFEHQKFEQAKFQYQLLISQEIPSSKRALALNNLASIHLQENDLKSAVQVSEQAFKMLPSPGIVDTFGWALVLSGELEQGLSYLRQAFSMYSTSPEIQYHIAYALVKLNRSQEAKVILAKIIKMPDTFNEHKLAVKLLNSISD